MEEAGSPEYSGFSLVLLLQSLGWAIMGWRVFFFLLGSRGTFLLEIWCNLFPFGIIEAAWQICDPMDCSLPGSSIHGILQARISFHSPGDLPDPGIEPGSPALQADSLPTELSGKPSNQGRSLEKEAGGNESEARVVDTRSETQR